MIESGKKNWKDSLSRENPQKPSLKKNRGKVLSDAMQYDKQVQVLSKKLPSQIHRLFTNATEQTWL